MNKKTKKDDGIKDSISKLFILRDSCQGTSITQKDNPNIIWFEGAAVLLQQGVDNLKKAQDTIDRGGDKAIKDFCADVKETVSKLIVLKRSWIVSRSEDSAENIIWFEGAESIISEVIDQLQKAQEKAESKTVITAADADSESEESSSSATAENSESEAAEEEDKTDDDSDEEEKQAAAV